MGRIGFLLLSGAAIAACSSVPTGAPAAPPPTGEAGSHADSARPEPTSGTPPAEDESARETVETDPERARLIAWLKSQMPEGGEITNTPSGPIGVTHVVRTGETYVKIAEAYVGFTEIYLTRDLTKTLLQTDAGPGGAPRPGSRIAIPSVVQSAPKSADDERIGWPEDKSLRGIYVRGGTADSSLYLAMLDRMVERGMNLIVLDAKDYDGLVTYHSKIPLVIETGAAKGAPIRDMARTVRFAHARGVRVAMRISCFEDEFMAKAKPTMSVQATWKRPYKIGWLDPANEESQAYILEMTKEALDTGVDEIELDYIRYPVLGIKGADFDVTKGKTPKTIVIRNFVRKVHELTEARKVPLSLDIFGVVAEGQRADIDMLGQDPALLAREVEALSPMVYPSHYRAGYNGFEIPGNHPEIVGIATRRILQQIHRIKKAALIRPWLQAMDYNSPEYGPAYLASEVKHATGAGAIGWLMWNPAQTYTVTWAGIPPDKARAAAVRAAGNAGPSAARAARAPYEAKGGDAKGAEGKGEAKAGEAKGEAKPGEAKTGEGKEGTAAEPAKPSSTAGPSAN